MRCQMEYTRWYSGVPLYMHQVFTMQQQTSHKQWFGLNCLYNMQNTFSSAYAGHT